MPTTKPVKNSFDSVLALYRRCRAHMVKHLKAYGLSDSKIADYLTLTTDTMLAFIKCADYTLSPVCTLEPPKYMFAERPVSPATWLELQSGQLDTYMLANNTALLIDPVTREYCYVFWDEGEQCSNPYPTQQAAFEAMADYITRL